MQQRDPPPGHVIWIHAALQQEPGGVEPLEVVAARPFRHVGHARAVAHEQLDHRVIAVLGRHRQHAFTPERQLMARERRLFAEQPFDGRQLIAIDQPLELRREA
jgi:hypothetical protein